MHRFHTLVAVALFVSCRIVSAHSGDLDLHFGLSGIAELAMPDSISPLIEPVDIDQSNRAIFGVSTASDDFIGAFDNAGNLDTSFGSSGFVALDQYLSDLKVDSKNRIVVLQSDISTSFVGIRVSRYLSDGSVDTAFGTGGSTLISRVDEDIVPNALTLDADDSIYFSGTEPSYPPTGDSRALIGKITASGERDRTFIGEGLISVELMAPGTEQTYGQAIAVDHHGKVLATAYTRLATKIIKSDVIRLMPDGTLDPSFGAGKGFLQFDALAATSAPHYTFSESLAIDASDNILTAGFAGVWDDFSSSMMVARFLTDGRVDPSFNAGAPTLLNPILYREAQAASIMLDGRGRIVLSGISALDVGAPNRLTAFRLNADGSVDTSYGDVSGYALHSENVAGGRGVLTHNGNLLIIGNTDDGSALITNELIGYDVPPISPPTHF